MNSVTSRTYLELSDYDLEFCRRLALSPKSQMQVKRTARVLLEMHRYADAGCLSMRTGIPVQVLGQIRQCYETEGLQQVLAAGVPVEVPGHSRRLVLDESERLFCRHIVDEQLGSAGRQRRARALLLLDQAFEKAEAARTSGLCERTLERLVERYQTHGAEGAVNDGPRLGRPVRYPREEFVPLIRQIVQQTRPEALLKWTMKDLRESLASHRREAAEISEPTLRTLMRQAGLNFRRIGFP
jgi:transposase